MATRFCNIKLKKRRAPTVKFFFLIMLTSMLVNTYVDLAKYPLMYFSGMILGAFLSWVVGTGKPIQAARSLRFNYFRHNRLSSNFEDNHDLMKLEEIKNLKGLVKERELK